MAAKLTEQQLKAVEFPADRPAIVTAAAGSGKTTLLVSRIARLLADRESGIRADRLAVMTFTRNAADNLRQKLNSRLSQMLAEPSDAPDAAERRAYLADQLIALRSASIGTIDSFCLNTIRENAQSFGLPVNFAVADSAAKAAMQSDAMELALRSFYDPAEGMFTEEERSLLFHTFSFEDDTALMEAVFNADLKLSSYDGAEELLDNAAAAYADEKALEARYIRVYSARISELIAQAYHYHLECKKAAKAYANAAENEAQQKVAESFAQYLKGDSSILRRLIKLSRPLRKSPSMEALDAFVLGLPAIGGNSVKIAGNDPRNPLKKRFTPLKNAVGDTIKKLHGFSFSLEEQRRILPEERMAVEAFVKLTKHYITLYREIKRTLGRIDFCDAELMLLQKLKTDEEFRRQLSERYACVVVDEFQDSNDVQAEIFRLIAGDRRFYVGDVKQAIYTFRGGNPDIMARLCGGDEGFTAIPLNRNFRSRAAVIDTVNAMFEGVMTQRFGGVDYADGSQLVAGADYPPIPAGSEKLYETEIHLLNYSRNRDDDDEEDMCAARFTARRVYDLVQSGFPVTVEGVTRPCSYADIAVFLRTNAKIKLYREALTELCVPVSAEGGKSFLETDEIRLMLDLLRVIDDPLRDEELLRVAMSPIYAMTAEELAEARLGLLGFDPDALDDEQAAPFRKRVSGSSLYACLNYCVKGGSGFSGIAADKEADEAEKALAESGIVRCVNPAAKRLIDHIRDFRFFMSSNSVENLIRRVFDDADIFPLICAAEGGKKRVANVRLLRKYAEDFERRDGGSLGDFLRFIGGARAFKQRVEEASAPDDSLNAVRIMTFHASKGLEMPVAVIAELDYEASQNDMKGAVILSHDYGLSLNYVDRKARYKMSTFAREAMKIPMREKLCGEELRLLYVAMTRAQEKLIIIGKETKKPEELTMLPDYAETAFLSLSPLKWMMSSLLRYCSDISEGAAEAGIPVGDIPATIYRHSEVVEPPALAKEQAEPPAPDTEAAARLVAAMSKPYHSAQLTQTRAKYTVTELAHSEEEQGAVVYLTKPSFAEGGRAPTGKEIGDAYHHFMEHFPLDKMRGELTDAQREDIAAEAMYALIDDGKLTEREGELIKTERIAAFFAGELGQRMLNSPRVEREKPFYAEVDARLFGADKQGAIDTISIQGRTDMYFYEDGGIVLVDYKSDTPEGLLKEKAAYAKQLAAYKYILPKVTGEEVKQSFLYAFSTGEALDIEEILCEQDEQNG